MINKNFNICEDIIKKCVFENIGDSISSRKIAQNYGMSIAQSRRLISKIVQTNLIYVLGKSGYLQNEQLIQIISNKINSKQTDFIQNHIIFESDYFTIKFDLFEFLEIMVPMGFTLDHNYTISELYTILIFILQKFSTFGINKIEYDKLICKQKVKTSFYRVGTKKLVFEIKYFSNNHKHMFYIN